MLLWIDRLLNVFCLTSDPYPQENIDFLEEEDITFHQIPMPGNKEETIRVAPESISAALRYILNPSHYPLLIHCNKGKHRTGCVVGCIRKLQNWDFQDIVEEYRLYSTPKSRPMDEQCIGQFEVEPVSFIISTCAGLRCLGHRLTHSSRSGTK